MIRRRKHSVDDPLNFVACEDTFDIVNLTHILTGHGGREKVTKDFNKKYTHVTQRIPVTEPRTSYHRSPGGERRDTTADTEPKTSHHRSSEGQRRAHSRGHHSIDRLHERGETLLQVQSQGHHAIDTWRREAGTEPGKSHHRSPAGERRAQSQGHHTIDRLEEREETLLRAQNQGNHTIDRLQERSGHRAKDITPSIGCGRDERHYCGHGAEELVS